MASLLISVDKKPQQNSQKILLFENSRTDLAEQAPPELLDSRGLATKPPAAAGGGDPGHASADTPTDVQQKFVQQLADGKAGKFTEGFF